LVAPDPARVATEGALRGAATKHDFLHEALIVSGDAGQFNVSEHALCWIHAERLAHKLETFTDPPRAIQQHMRGLIWWFDSSFKADRSTPCRRGEVCARFDRTFQRCTGFIMLDCLLQRLHANEAELLIVLDRLAVPPHTNGSENDIRSQITKRQISGGTQSDLGCDCHNALRPATAQPWVCVAPDISKTYPVLRPPRSFGRSRPRATRSAMSR
jgi:hypothetical protein